MAKAEKQIKSRELGFGQKAYSKGTRLITPGGNFNVEKRGMGFWQRLDIYHELVTIRWWKFFGLITASFFLANLVFAFIYFLSGIKGISGLEVHSRLELFLSSFYFSTQTITTVGFGKLSPNSNLVSFIAAFESFLGLLGFALATGLMFARFSRPRRNLVYSTEALIAPYMDLNGLMFRFANKSQTQLVEAEVDMTITYWNSKSDRRIFKQVNLERRKINFFSTSWTVVHPIDEKSPIWSWTRQDFENRQVEVIIMFKAFDDSYARHVYDRMSYIYDEIEWGRKFEPIFDQATDGRIHIDLHRLSAHHKAPLN